MELSEELISSMAVGAQSKRSHFLEMSSIGNFSDSV